MRSSAGSIPSSALRRDSRRAPLARSRARACDRAQQDVLGGVLELDELDHLDVIAHGAEQLGPRGIGDLGGGSAHAGCRAGAAGRGRRSRSCPSSSCWQHGTARITPPRRVRRGRALHRSPCRRVQADDEVDPVERVVAGDVPDGEPQSVCAEAPGQRLAVRDHVLLQVEPDEVDIAPVHGREQVMEREHHRTCRSRSRRSTTGRRAVPASHPPPVPRSGSPGGTCRTGRTHHHSTRVIRREPRSCRDGSGGSRTCSEASSVKASLHAADADWQVLAGGKGAETPAPVPASRSPSARPRAHRVKVLPSLP